MNPHDHIEDAEFEDFLKGEGDLARQLRELPQPQPPEALSAAILAQAASDMHSGAAVSANDAVHDAAPASPPARHFLRRARVPLGLAASAVFALFAVRSLMPQFDAPMAEPQQPVVPMAAPPQAAVPVPAQPAAVVESPPPPPKAIQSKRSVARPTPAADIAAAVAAADAEAAAPPVVPAPAFPMAAPAPLARRQAPVMAVAKSSPNTMTYFGSPQAEALPAPAWLARIDEMLKAGETKEAHAEWLKFRMRYPDADVPPELQRQLEAVN